MLSLLDEKSCDSFIEEYICKESLDHEYLTLNKNLIMEKCYLHLKKTQIIDNEDIAYFKDNYFFTEKDFLLIFNYLRDFAVNQDKIKEEDMAFNNEYFCMAYKDIKIILRLVYGQGTLLQMRTDLVEDLWDDEKYFNFDEIDSTVRLEYQIDVQCILPDSKKIKLNILDNYLNKNMLFKPETNISPKYTLYSQKEVREFLSNIIVNKNNIRYLDCKSLTFIVNKKQGSINLSGDIIVLRYD